MQENAPYREACIIGNEFSRLGSHLVNLKKKNEVAILVSNEALTALKWFGIEATAAGDHGIGYNDVVRWLYDTLFKMNVECDFVWPESDNLDQYKAIFVPALYAAPDELLEKLKQYTANGGTLVATFKTAFANENVKVSHEMQPHILSNCFGISYQQFTFPKNTGLSGSIINGTAKDSDEKAEAKVFMELLMPQEAEVLASYDHYNWKEYAAITKNHYGKGTAIYIGCMTDDNTLKAVLTEALNSAEVEIPEYSWPVIVRKGINDLNKCVRYILNYSAEEQNVIYHGANGTELFSEESVQDGDTVTVLPWNLTIVDKKLFSNSASQQICNQIRKIRFILIYSFISRVSHCQAKIAFSRNNRNSNCLPVNQLIRKTLDNKMSNFMVSCASYHFFRHITKFFEVCSKVFHNRFTVNAIFTTHTCSNHRHINQVLSAVWIACVVVETRRVENNHFDHLLRNANSMEFFQLPNRFLQHVVDFRGTRFSY